MAKYIVSITKVEPVESNKVARFFGVNHPIKETVIFHQSLDELSQIPSILSAVISGFGISTYNKPRKESKNE
jgi:hypothetical protein